MSEEEIRQLKIEVVVLRDAVMYLCLHTFKDRISANRFVEVFCAPVVGLPEADPLKIALEESRSDFAERFQAAGEKFVF